MKKSVGMMGIILGGLCLSLEVYFLKVIQGMEKAVGLWYENVWDYAKESPCLIAFAITVLVIALSAYVFAKGE